MLSALGSRIRTLFAIYCCICLVGCVTPKVIEYTEATGSKEALQWKVNSVTFAAIRNNRQVRMCVELSSANQRSKTEIIIDLQQLTEQLNAQGRITGGLEDGVNSESSLCSPELDTGEKALPVSEIHSDAQDLVEALQSLGRLPLEEPVVYLLHHMSESYLVFGMPSGMYEGLDKHAIGSYSETEIHYSGSIFILLPLALAVDAVIIGTMIILFIPCVIPVLLPLCIPFAIAMGIVEESAKQSHDDSYPAAEDEDLFD